MSNPSSNEGSDLETDDVHVNSDQQVSESQQEIEDDPQEQSVLFQDEDSTPVSESHDTESQQENNNADEEKKAEETVDKSEVTEKAEDTQPEEKTADTAADEKTGDASKSENVTERSTEPIQSPVKSTDKSEKEHKKDEEDMTGSEEEVFRAELKPKKIIDPEFKYNFDEMVSRPMISEDSGIPENLLVIHHSFGFDALRRQNLQLLEPDVACYVTGNYLEISNFAIEEKSHLRTTMGFGIGAFSVHPDKNAIAIAEKGENPPVCIYLYPSLELYRILEEGTQKAYAACEFSPDGEMIATVGSDPDYMLTLWEWRNEQIVLRAKAFSQDIYRVAWSSDLAGVLTTAGSGHIRFWKMASTFTGLKLQGKLGKFGKTELSDIEGFVTLPDGKVLTGSAWGNLLVWEGDLIKTWDFETVDTAECLEEGAIFELEPMNELQVGPQAKLMHIVKLQDEESTVWYAQDSDGAIWKLDLSFSHTSQAPESLIRFHSDSILDCVTSPYAYTAATIGVDGRVCIYDILNKTTILRRRFPAGGSRLIWSPSKVDPKGKTIVAGFQDGVVRVLQFGENPETDPTRKAKHFALLDLGQALKPHTKAVSDMAYNATGDYFVTGSEDETIFFFAVRSKMLIPIGFYPVGDVVVKLEWLPSSKSIGEVIVYLERGCVISVPCPSMSDIDHDKSFALPNVHATGGYHLLSIKSQLIHDETSEIKIKRYEDEKKTRLELRAARAVREPETEEDAQRYDDEEELIRQGMMSELADWAPSYPETPSRLTYATLDRNNPKQFWMAFNDFDTGYIYNCVLGSPPMSDEEARSMRLRKKAERIAMLQTLAKKQNDDDDEDGMFLNDPMLELPSESNDAEAMEEEEEEDDANRELQLADRLEEIPPQNSIKFEWNQEASITFWVFSASGMRVFIGFSDGCVRVQLLGRAFDLSSLKDYWSFRVHDNTGGWINKVTLSHDEKFLISVSKDGTFFVYDLMSEDLQNKEMKEYRSRIPSAYEAQSPSDDIVDPKACSIEQAKQREEYERLMNLVEQKKAETRKKVTELRLRFRRLKEQNEKLPDRIRLGKDDFNLVPHIRDDLFTDRKAKVDLVYRETAWTSEKYRLALGKLENVFRRPLDFDRIVVRAFCTGHCVTSTRCNKVSDELVVLKADLIRQREERLDKMAQMEQRTGPGDVLSNVEDIFDRAKATSDSGLQQMKGARGLRVARKLHKLEEAQRKRNARRAQWDTLQLMKPADNYEDPADLQEIKLAKERMGDFKLKSSQNYVVADQSKLNAFESKFRLVELLEEAFNLRHEFNASVIKLRDKKIKIIEHLKRINRELIDITLDLPEGEPGYRLDIPEMGLDEYPEKEFQYDKVSLLQFKKSRDEKLDSSNSQVSKFVIKSKSDQNPKLFSESMFPEYLYPNGPTIEDDCTTTNEADVEGVECNRLIIRIPINCLGAEVSLVSLTRELSHCALIRPPRTGILGTPVSHMIHLDEDSLEPFEGLRLIRTNEKVRPDKLSVAHDYILIDPTEADEESEPVVELNPIRTVLTDASSSEVDNLKELPAPEDSNIVEQSLELEPRSSEMGLEVICKLYPVEYAERMQRQVQSMYQRQELINTAGRLVRCFDAEVRLTRHKRFKMDVLFKRAELHQLTLYEEFRLLKEFEKSETVLTEKKQLKDTEKQEVTAKITDLNIRIDNRKKELERLAQREHAVHEEFRISLGEGHRFSDFLAKVFKKRIKRKKQESTDVGSNASEDSESSSDDSSFDEDEDESDDDENVLDLETCPPGCAQEDYDNTCAIRERRLDVEDDINEEKRALDLLRKDLDAWTKKQRVVEVGQKQAQSELEAFQLEKQRKLNELDTVVVLRMSQVELFENCTVPADLSDGLVFKRSNLRLLLARIHELQDEKKQQRREKLDAKERHVMLQKHKKLFQTEIEKMSDKCDHEMIDKFGKIDDIERMEGVVVNPKLEELTTKMLILQEECEKSEKELEERIRDARDACIIQIQENTTFLSKTLMIFSEKEKLQTQLNAKQGAKMGYIDTSDNEMEAKEIQRLLNLVKIQENEITELSKEIGILTRVSLSGSKRNDLIYRKGPTAL